LNFSLATLNLFQFWQIERLDDDLKTALDLVVSENALLGAVELEDSLADKK